MFKVGDKVKIVGRSGVHHFFLIGTTAKVVGLDDGYGSLVLDIHDGDGFIFSQNVSPQDVELVATHSHEAPPTNITSETDSILGSITVTDAKESNVLFMAHLYHGLGMSFRQVAKLTNVHERTVRRRFKKYGIPSRPMNGVK